MKEGKGQGPQRAGKPHPFGGFAGGLRGLFAFHMRGPWTLLRVLRKSEMNKYLYLQQQIEQTLHSFPLPFQSFQYRSPSRPAPSPSPALLCAGVIIWVSTPPPKAQERRDQGEAWLREGCGVSFHILLCSKPGTAVGGGHQEQREVEKRTAPPPHVPAPPPTFTVFPGPGSWARSGSHTNPLLPGPG